MAMLNNWGWFNLDNGDHHRSYCYYRPFQVVFLTHSVISYDHLYNYRYQSSIYGGCGRVRRFYLTVLPATAVPAAYGQGYFYLFLGATAARALRLTGFGYQMVYNSYRWVGLPTTGPIPSTAVAGTFTWWVTPNYCRMWKPPYSNTCKQ